MLFRSFSSIRDSKCSDVSSSERKVLVLSFTALFSPRAAFGHVNLNSSSSYYVCSTSRIRVDQHGSEIGPVIDMFHVTRCHTSDNDRQFSSPPGGL